MRKLTLYLINPSGELDLGYIDLDEDIAQDVKDDFMYDASTILESDGVEVDGFFRATDESTDKKYDLAVRFTREFLSTAENEDIKALCGATIGAFFRLAEGIKEGTYS